MAKITKTTIKEVKTPEVEKKIVEATKVVEVSLNEQFMVQVDRLLESIIKEERRTLNRGEIQSICNSVLK